MNRVHPTALLAMGVAWVLPHATSAASTHIVLSISGCEAAAVQADRLFDLARTELAPRTVVAGDGARDLQAPHLSVRLCQGSANGVTLEWQDFGGAVVLRQLDLSDVVGDLRTRTLAVALAELVVSVPANASAANRDGHAAPAPAAGNAAVPNAPPTQPPTTPAPPELVASADAAPPRQNVPLSPVVQIEPATKGPSRTPALRASAGAALREFFNPRTTLVGPWLSVASRRISAEAQFLTASNEVTQSGARLGTVTLYDAGLTAIYHAFAWGSSIVASTNLRAELGNTWASGEPGAAVNIRKLPTKSSPHLGAALDLTADATILGDLGIQFHLLVGGNAWGVTARAFNQAVASTEGVFAGALLGLNYRIAQ